MVQREVPALKGKEITAGWRRLHKEELHD